MANNILVSFIGSHDNGDREKDIKQGPLSRILEYLTRKNSIKAYIFLTEQIEEMFYEEGLDKIYKENHPEVEFIFKNTKIKDPTNEKEIVEKISAYVDEINENKTEKNSMTFVNLASGTPTTRCVLSLMIITGQLINSIGIYASNPQYDETIKYENLDYYRNSFGYRMIKSLINNCDYDGVENYLKNNKRDLPKLVQNEKFMDLLKFAQKRIIGDFETISTMIKEKENLKEINYKAPQNLYERGVEFYNCAKISIDRKKDIFQGVLKLGIIRENLVTYLCQKMMERCYPKTTIIEYFENKRPIFKIEALEEYAKDMKEHISKKHSMGLSTSNVFDFKRPIESYGEALILDFLLRVKSNNESKNYKILLDMVNRLETLKDVRNGMAHTLTSPKYDQRWITNIENILNLISEEFGEEAPNYKIYENINTKLVNLLKVTLNA